MTEGGRFAGERVLVIGCGVAGSAAARVLAEEGAVVRVSERRTEIDDVDGLRELGIDVRLGGHRPEHLDGVSAVVASPGVPAHAEILRWAADRGTEVWSELDVGARLCTVPYVAITGTNGKTTTTTMVAAMLRAAGLDAVACGNIGHPFSIAARERHDALSVEASSFQLHLHHRVHPKVSVLLNVAADHLDWHGSMRAYADAKARIFELQRGDEVHIGNAQDPVAAEVSRRAGCRVAWFTLDEPADGQVGYMDGIVVARIDAREVRLDRPVLDAAGFRADAAAAAAAGLAFGLPAEAVAEGIRATRPLPHRGEEVARAGGVRFLDDSKATNVHAALNALAGRRDVVLIAGGLSKGADLSPLADAMPSLAGVVAIGDAAPELVGLFEGQLTVRKADPIEEAVRAAYELAVPDRAVLLAPACASWDMFRDYVERGERFAAAARAIAEEVAPTMNTEAGS
ncbi:MAG TPA: UDP-N-acetylmuramoyl-L-alanine--D-glutamate ligase [Actinomycetota bacterium]|nr:UDP-N-acetylmuramoyl-L-alanine--D-glutamate ligase [Actinomycetota bacterium]